MGHFSNALEFSLQWLQFLQQEETGVCHLKLHWWRSQWLTLDNQVDMLSMFYTHIVNIELKSSSEFLKSFDCMNNGDNTT